MAQGICSEKGVKGRTRRILETGKRSACLLVKINSEVLSSLVNISSGVTIRRPAVYFTVRWKNAENFNKNSIGQPLWQPFPAYASNRFLYRTHSFRREIFPSYSEQLLPLFHLSTKFIYNFFNQSSHFFINFINISYFLNLLSLKTSELERSKL